MQHQTFQKQKEMWLYCIVDIYFIIYLDLYLDNFSYKMNNKANVSLSLTSRSVTINYVHVTCTKQYFSLNLVVCESVMLIFQPLHFVLLWTWKYACPNWQVDGMGSSKNYYGIFPPVPSPVTDTFSLMAVNSMTVGDDTVLFLTYFSPRAISNC